MRDTTGDFDFQAQRQAGARPRVFLEADFGAVAGVFRAFGDHYDFIWNGQTWHGGGDLIGISGAKESADRARNGLTFTLAPKDATASRNHVGEAMVAETGGDARIWHGYIDNEGELVLNPVCVFAGQVNGPRIVGQPDGTSLVEVSVEQRLRDLDRGQRYRMTAASQARRDPTDKGFEFLSRLATRKANFGSVNANRFKED